MKIYDCLTQKFAFLNNLSQLFNIDIEESEQKAHSNFSYICNWNYLNV